MSSPTPEAKRLKVDPVASHNPSSSNGSATTHKPRNPRNANKPPRKPFPPAHTIWHLIKNATIDEPVSFEHAESLKVENADVYDILGRDRLLEMEREEKQAIETNPDIVQKDRKGKKRPPIVHPYWTQKAKDAWPASTHEFQYPESLVDIEISSISVYGDGLAILSLEGKPCRVLSVPYALPGDKVKVRIYAHDSDALISRAFIEKFYSRSDWRSPATQEQIEQRKSSVSSWSDSSIKHDPQYIKGVDDTREVFGDQVECRYFGSCAGCQIQPLDYARQLDFKRLQVSKAFSHWSGLDPSEIPDPLPTIASPDQYGNRTKLTPHFDLRRRRRVPPLPTVEGAPAPESSTNDLQHDSPNKDIAPFGFTCKQSDGVMDIEECPLATPVVNHGLRNMRQVVAEKMRNKEYKRGATVLLRDSLVPIPEAQYKPGVQGDDSHICVSDFRSLVRQRVGHLDYEQVAHAFFQNNSAILPNLIKAIHERCGENTRYFIDAYCGSGLFSVALAPHFDKIEGIDIDRSSIVWASRNAARNHGEEVASKVRYIEGKSEILFKDVSLPNQDTTIMIDPPRKGCDELFLRQLLAFNPARVVYLSCNVHTQARDIGWLVRESQKQSDPSKDRFPFRIMSVCAADLFPNTYHAEGLAVLDREVQKLPS